MKNEGVLLSNMGSCECGNVYTPYILGRREKRVYVPANMGERWMRGYIEGTRFCVPYAGHVEIGEEGYSVHAVSLPGLATLEELKKALKK